MKQLILFAVLATGSLPSHTFAQSDKFPISPEEVIYLRQAFATIDESDQRYRSYLTYNTLDDRVIERIDSVMNSEGIEAGLAYSKSLNLSMTIQEHDSVQSLQHQLDFQNQLMIRGIWEIYGFIPKEIVEEKNYVQLLLMLHPCKDWDIPSFHRSYAALLREEVRAGRMPAETYATFFDNILCKIMRKPQLYGTNQQFDRNLGKVLPPEISDLSKTNAARAELGLPVLKEGEYRLTE